MVRGWLDWREGTGQGAPFNYTNMIRFGFFLGSGNMELGELSTGFNVILRI